MNWSMSRHWKIARMVIAGTGLILLAAFLFPSSVMAQVRGWVRCGTIGSDICYTDGNVGIGTNNPATRLHISGLENDGNSATLTIHSTTGAFNQTMLMDGNEIDGFQNLHLNRNTSAVVTIAEGGGNVGIGVNSPQDVLHLFRNAPVTVGVLMGNSYTGDDRSGFLVNYHHSGAGAELWNFENTDMWFGTNNTRRMTIENDGDIGIGTSNPNSLLEISNGYIELDTSNGMPPGHDCDATDEIGRMKVDSVNTNLYVCTARGWVRK